MIPTGRNQSVMSATTHQPGKMPLCLGVESMRSLNFLFVCVSIRSLPRVAESRARRSRSVHRAGKLAFRKQKAIEREPKTKGLRSPEATARPGRRRSGR